MSDKKVGCRDFWISEQVKLISFIFRDRLLKYFVRWSLLEQFSPLHQSSAVPQVGFQLTSVHLWKVSSFSAVLLELVMKALPKTQLLGNMSHCCSVAVLVSRVHQDAESFRSIHKHKESKTKLLECGREGNVCVLQFRVARVQSDERELCIVSPAKNERRARFITTVCASHTQCQ